MGNKQTRHEFGKATKTNQSRLRAQKLDEEHNDDDDAVVVQSTHTYTSIISTITTRAITTTPKTTGTNLAAVQGYCRGTYVVVDDNCVGVTNQSAGLATVKSATQNQTLSTATSVKVAATATRSKETILGTETLPIQIPVTDADADAVVVTAAIVAAAPTTTTAAAITTTTTANHKRSRQFSTWSSSCTFGRGGGGHHRLNWSFSSVYSSFRNRNKLARKSLHSFEGSKRSKKTIWHKPLTNAIFITHFPESSRNEQLEIVHLINKGAFGVVFKVTTDAQKLLQQRRQQHQQQQQQPQETQPQLTALDTICSSRQCCYALKVLKKSKIIEENSVQQIKDEADIQKICGHHPFIVQQIARWQNRYNLHILSEYVPNGELFSKISHFTADLVRIYTAEIALAIDFLHNAGIIYRDAKPENILLTEHFHIKLTDFGLSKWLKLGATTGTMCGTLKYIAPEVLRGERYGHAVDWWALGVIVCQMLTQKSPNIRRYLAAIDATSAASSKAKDVGNGGDGGDGGDGGMEKATSVANINGCLMERYDYLPHEAQQLSRAALDLLKRLLELEPRQRIRSVLSLQRIAFYMNFKIDAKTVLKLKPLDIIERDKIHIYMDNQYEETCSALAKAAFQDF